MKETFTYRVSIQRVRKNDAPEGARVHVDPTTREDPIALYKLCDDFAARMGRMLRECVQTDIQNEEAGLCLEEEVPA